MTHRANATGIGYSAMRMKTHRGVAQTNGFRSMVGENSVESNWVDRRIDSSIRSSENA